MEREERSLTDITLFEFSLNNQSLSSFSYQLVQCKSERVTTSCIHSQKEHLVLCCKTLLKFA